MKSMVYIFLTGLTIITFKDAIIENDTEIASKYDEYHEKIDSRVKSASFLVDTLFQKGVYGSFKEALNIDNSDKTDVSKYDIVHDMNSDGKVDINDVKLLFEEYLG